MIVTPYSTKLSVEKGIKLNVFSPETNVNKFKNIPTLLYHKIKWEQVRRSEIPQCRNCQRFFHSAANCYLPRRCVKCNTNYEKCKCSIEKVSIEEKGQLFCVLCNKYEHVAFYKGCEKYKLLKQKISIKKKKSK